MYEEHCNMEEHCFCRPNPFNPSLKISHGGLTVSSTGCTNHITSFFDFQHPTWVSRSIGNYTIVVISTGAWDQLDISARKCLGHDPEGTVRLAVATLAKIQREDLIIIY